MTYHDVAAAAQDNHLRLRVAGCVATLDYTPTSERTHVLAIADSIMWEVAGESAVSDAYAYGVATDVENPGDDPAVVTDVMILAAVEEALGIA